MPYNQRYGKKSRQSQDRVDVDEREAQYDRCLALNQRVASAKGYEYRPIFAYGSVVRTTATAD